MKFTLNYTRLAQIACGYFCALAFLWLCTTWIIGHRFNATALLLTAAYAGILWWRNRIADLVTGVLSLFFSFFLLMDVLNTFDLLSKNREFNFAAQALLILSVVCIVMSVLLILSFTRSLRQES
jgi:hypothetical protein